MAQEQHAASSQEHGAKTRAQGGGHRSVIHEEHHEGAPEWLISFADNVTLMMGFFVILLALNMAQKVATAGTGPAGEGAPSYPDTLDWAISLREAFNNPVNLNSMDPNDLPLVRRLLERRGLAQVDENGPRGDAHKVQGLRPIDYSRLSTAVFFDDHSPRLTTEGREAVRNLASHVRGLRFIIQVRGHVSSAEAKGEFEQAMRLSFERAAAVSDMLIAEGLDPRQVRILACGDSDRLAQTAYAQAAHRRNQYVDVIVTDEVMPRRPDEGGPAVEVPESQPAR